jgi:hypothetical protein
MQLRRTAMVLGVVATLLTFGMIATTYSIENQAFAQGQPQQQGDSLVVQNTTTSIQDPVPGHSAHQLALVAPPREDGKIWSGVVTFTASKAVDIVVLHPYDRPEIVATNQSFGEPLNAPNPFAAGSLPFAGTALAFHTTTGEPFTVSYTLDAEAKSPTTQ